MAPQDTQGMCITDTGLSSWTWLARRAQARGRAIIALSKVPPGRVPTKAGGQARG
jgi:hypothetical protein